MGTVVLGKVESGKVAKGDALLLMPNKVTDLFATVINVSLNDSYTRVGVQLELGARVFNAVRQRYTIQ